MHFFSVVGTSAFEHMYVCMYVRYLATTYSRFHSKSGNSCAIAFNNKTMPTVHVNLILCMWRGDMDIHSRYIHTYVHTTTTGRIPFHWFSAILIAIHNVNALSSPLLYSLSEYQSVICSADSGYFPPRISLRKSSLPRWLAPHPSDSPPAHFDFKVMEEEATACAEDGSPKEVSSRHHSRELRHGKGVDSEAHCFILQD